MTSTSTRMKKLQNLSSAMLGFQDRYYHLLGKYKNNERLEDLLNLVDHVADSVVSCVDCFEYAAKELKLQIKSYELVDDFCSIFNKKIGRGEDPIIMRPTFPNTLLVGIHDDNLFRASRIFSQFESQREDFVRTESRLYKSLLNNQVYWVPDAFFPKYTNGVFRKI